MQKLKEYLSEPASYRYFCWAVIALLLVAEVSFAWKIQAFQWLPETEVLPLIRIGSAIGVCALALQVCNRVHAHFESRVKSNWWDPNGNSARIDLDWDDLLRLVSGNKDLDPLNILPKIHLNSWLIHTPLQFVAYLMVTTFTLTILDFLRNPTPRTFLLEGASIWGGSPLAKPVLALMSNPAPFVMTVGLATIFFAFRQIRAKVRADSRQAWIIRARQLIGEVVAEIDEHQVQLGIGNKQRAREIWARVNPKRLELELMLNPSEKDHRVLMHLIQALSAWRLDPLEIQDARNLIYAIRSYYTCAGEYFKWETILNPRTRHEHVSYILRLSHVVLKREWERVKSIQ